MRAALFPLAVLLVLVLGPGGCGSLQNRGDDFPLSGATPAVSFPAYSEITATIGLSREGAKEDYLLALSTRAGAFEAQFLTPQGIPVASVVSSGKKLHISNLAPMARLLSPEVIMGYLELIYLDDEGVNLKLRPGWISESGGDERRFLRLSNAGTPVENFSIRYRGEAPWFRVVDVIDRGRGQLFSLRILGQSNVISE